MRQSTIVALAVGLLFGMRPSVAQDDFWELPSFNLTSRVLSLASSPRGYLFAGTNDRKVVRSSDGGTTWTDVGDAQLSPSIPALAVDSVGTVFAGTDFRGVFRSTDDGATWIPSTLTQERISCLLLGAGGAVFAGVWDEGIYRSTDGGSTWILVGAPGNKVRAIIETPEGVLIAATDTTAQEGRLYRSTDGGLQWTRIGLGLSSGVVHSLVSVSAETLFAGTAGQGIYRSTNTGDFWSSSYLLIPSTVSALTYVDGQGIFAGMLQGGGGILRTTDTGGSWFPEVSGLLNLDILSLIKGRDGRLYAGTGEGVYRSVRVLTAAQEHDQQALTPGVHLDVHPNPFNGEAVISFTVSKPGPLCLTAYDLRGRRTHIVQRSTDVGGSFRVRWVADNRSSGMYIVLLETAEGRQVTKALLVK